MHPLKKTARIAGAIYLSMVFTAPFTLLYVPGKLIVRGDAAATANNILAHETMFRFAIIGDLFTHVIFICLGIALYRLLSSVGKTWALLMVVLVSVSAAVGFLDTLNNVAALILFRGADFLSVFDKAQLNALGYLFVRLHGQGIFMNELFWGLWLFPFGLLVFRSGFLPRFIGGRSEEHTSELQSLAYLVCRLLLEKKNFIYATLCFLVYTRFHAPIVFITGFIAYYIHRVNIPIAFLFVGTYDFTTSMIHVVALPVA